MPAERASIRLRAGADDLLEAIAEVGRRAEASPLRNPLDRLAGCLQQGLRLTQTATMQPLQWCRADLFAEAAIERARAHARLRRDLGERQLLISAEVLHPSADLSRMRARVSVRALAFPDGQRFPASFARRWLRLWLAGAAYSSSVLAEYATSLAKI